MQVILKRIRKILCEYVISEAYAVMFAYMNQEFHTMTILSQHRKWLPITGRVTLVLMQWTRPESHRLEDTLFHPISEECPICRSDGCSSKFERATQQ